MSVAGLSYMSEIEKSKNVELVQKFIYDQLSIVANLSMKSKVIDALVNFENTYQGNIFNSGL